MTLRFLLAFFLACAVAASAAPKPPTYTCFVTVDPPTSQAPDDNWLTVSGTAPRKAVVYLRITTATAVEAVWTALHNVRGAVGPDLTTRVLYPGDYTAQLIDGSIGPDAVFAECPFTVE